MKLINKINEQSEFLLASLKENPEERIFLSKKWAKLSQIIGRHELQLEKFISSKTIGRLKQWAAGKFVEFSSNF